MDGLMEESINSFLQHLIVEKGFSRNTLDAYRNDLSQFREYVQERLKGPADEDNPWRTVDLTVLNEYIADLRVRKGYRDTTTARKVAAIKSFFSFLCLNGIVTEDPGRGLGWGRLSLHQGHTDTDANSIPTTSTATWQAPSLSNNKHLGRS